MTALSRTPGRDDVRADILEASLALMNEGGLGALSMREVARRAGVSHQAPYHYFADREAILAELAGNGFQKLYECLVAAIGQASDRVSGSRAMGEAYIRFALSQPELFRLMFRNEMCDLDRYPEARAKAEMCLSLVAETLGAGGVPADRTSPDLTPVIAQWAAAHGLATLLLEGKLKEAFGEGADRQTEAAGRVIAFFSERFNRQRAEG